MNMSQNGSQEIRDVTKCLQTFPEPQGHSAVCPDVLRICCISINVTSLYTYYHALYMICHLSARLKSVNISGVSDSAEL